MGLAPLQRARVQPVSPRCRLPRQLCVASLVSCLVSWRLACLAAALASRSSGSWRARRAGKGSGRTCLHLEGISGELLMSGRKAAVHL